MEDEKGRQVDEDHNFISCLGWVPRGFAKRKPDRVFVDDALDVPVTKPGYSGSDGASKNDVTLKTEEDDDDDESDEVDDELDDDEEDVDEDDVDEDDVVKKYKLDDYDDDDATDVGFSHLVTFRSNDEDPYVTLKDADESDDEDDEILPTDNLALVGHVDGDVCSLEVHSFSASESHSFVHHDFLLPSLPLCLEWIGFDPTGGDDNNPGTRGNLMAMGYMTNIIDVWDMDMMDPLEPAFQLGNVTTSPKKKNKKPKTSAPSESFGHTDAVLSLAWNPLQSHVLASGSADETVQLWDLNQAKPEAIINLFQEKVQSLCWHPVEAHNILGGACDATARLIDCRNPDKSHKTWTFDAEVEKVVFYPSSSPFSFLVGTEDGKVYSMDARSPTPLFTLAAHDDAVTAAAFSPDVPGCLVTASMDKTLKIWDVSSSRPSLVLTKNFKIGPIHCADFCPDAGLVVALGGNKGAFKIWNAGKSAAVREAFGEKEEEAGSGEESEEEGRRDGDAENDVCVAHDDGTEGANRKPLAADHKLEKKKKKKKKKKKSDKNSENEGLAVVKGPDASGVAPPGSKRKKKKRKKKTESMDLVKTEPSDVAKTEPSVMP